jgi:hypothetical protein
VLVTVALGASAAPAQPPITVIVDGQPLRTPAPVVNRQGVLLLPLRAVFEALHADVRWYPCERKIEARRGEDFLELWVGTPVAQINHSPLQLRVPPLVINEITYVPVRVPAEAFGARVRWEAERRRVVVSSPLPSPRP